MVQQGYATVYRHQSFEFREAKVSDGHVAQRVHIIDVKGEAWEALYTLEQQPDGTLKITGCSLLKAGQSAWKNLPRNAAASSEIPTILLVAGR